jgi:putative phosphoesterase
LASTTRILLLSDTHGQVHPEILSLAARVDIIVHAGDIGNANVLEALREGDRPLHAITGNNDTPGKWSTADREALSGLPAHLQIDLRGGVLAVEHGHRANPVAKRHKILRDRYPDARLIVYGHSHRQLVDDAERPWVVNPGAAGRSRTFGGAGCVMLTIVARNWRLEACRFAL